MSLNESSNNDEDVVSLKEAYEEEKIREEDAIAVLGAADENNCSYPNGYVERQAIFSCRTCDPLKTKPAGVCYACSIHCHQGHILIELYTKRNFCCDCGNSKFDEKCKLHEEKEELNTQNSYNHNFGGVYCTCARPYPDPDDEIEDEMIQCLMCEDWYHSRHLGCLAPADYAEMICDQCIKKHSFLKYYKSHEVPPVVTVSKSETDQNVDVTTTTVAPTLTETNTAQDSNTEIPSACLLERLKQKHGEIPKEELLVMFLEDGWRTKLCQCETCLALYEKNNISYIVNEKDTIKSYEAKGKQNVENVLEEAATTISNMDKVQQVELMQGYHELKSGLQDFVNGFSEGQVIRKEDVDKFFENLNSKKRRRMDDDGSPHY